MNDTHGMIGLANIRKYHLLAVLNNDNGSRGDFLREAKDMLFA